MNKGIVIFIEGETEVEFYKKLLQSIRPLCNDKKMENLFKKANKVYIKGGKTTDFLDSLDIKKIMGKICCEIKPLCKELGANCSGDICKKDGR